jgi:sugar phosphate isomerase/epimerase
MTPIAIQMWTVREEANRSVSETLAGLKKSGYDAVETAGLYGMTAKQMSEQLANAGLTLCSAHTPLPAADQADEVFGQLAELGATAAFCSLNEQHFVDDVAVGKAAERFNAVIGAAAGHGIEFGYHNHWWEFTNNVNGGSAYELFLRRIDQRAILEIDTYWAEVGGVSATELVTSLAPRAAFLHIKDGPVDRDSPQVAVGDGRLDIGQVTSASTDVRWNIVELDDYEGNIWDAVGRSISYLSTLSR